MAKGGETKKEEKAKTDKTVSVKEENVEEQEKKPIEEKKTEEDAKPVEKRIKRKKGKEEVHTINLREAYDKPRTRRAKVAIDLIKAYVRKHKRKPAVISPELNEIIWERSIEKPPRKIRVRLLVEDEKVTVYPV